MSVFASTSTQLIGEGHLKPALICFQGKCFLLVVQCNYKVLTQNIYLKSNKQSVIRDAVFLYICNPGLAVPTYKVILGMHEDRLGYVNLGKNCTINIEASHFSKCRLRPYTIWLYIGLITSPFRTKIPSRQQWFIEISGGKSNSFLNCKNSSTRCKNRYLICWDILKIK